MGFVLTQVKGANICVHGIVFMCVCVHGGMIQTMPLCRGSILECNPVGQFPLDRGLDWIMLGWVALGWKDS